MATFTKEQYTEQKLTIFRVSHLVAASDLFDELGGYYDGSPSKYTIWDFSSADLSQLSAEDLKGIARFVISHANERNDGKVGLIFTSDINFGIGRMYDAQHEIEQSIMPRESFRRIEDALAWMGIELD